ncbi:hypothetical protein TURU_029573 [Turdus rufiventris]|nr:hypothetical protein TURU_029573 [Turdus rufiventris]
MDWAALERHLAGLQCREQERKPRASPASLLAASKEFQMCPGMISGPQEPGKQRGSACRASNGSNQIQISLNGFNIPPIASLRIITINGMDWLEEYLQILESIKETLAGGEVAQAGWAGNGQAGMELQEELLEEF